MVEQYLLLHHKKDILQILQDDDITKHHSINMSFLELFDNDTSMGNDVLNNPDEAFPELDEWIIYVQDVLLEDLKDTNFQPKQNVHARVYGLPTCPDFDRTIFPKSQDFNLFLQVTGTVVRVTASKMLEFQRSYICTKCKGSQMVKAIYEQKYIIIPSKQCLHPDCGGTNFTSLGELTVENCKDYQEVKIQEQASKSEVSTMPSSMWVTLEDDLVESCKPGDDVTICGIVKRRWGTLTPGKRIEVELILKANHVQVNNAQTCPSLITPEVKEQFTNFWEKHKHCPLDGRDFILKSFCSKLYGMYIVKLAMAMVLAGGSASTEGVQNRSEPHILLVGDPGTGKSQMLRYAAKIIPRSVLTTGVGTTSAGLTVAAVQEDGQWQLEGGALVLADGGICCIDEFNSMKPNDRTSIHEAMEQQTISVAKASMVCKLRTRCSIIAATNPKGGHLDSSQPLSLNLLLPTPLLSRFDIVLLLKDHYNPEWDNVVADYILSGKAVNMVNLEKSLWNLEMLQQYFTVIRSMNPRTTVQSDKILSCYYQAQRRAKTRNQARTTVRLLDSLVRLSQAHAKLMFHTDVHVMDALFAVMIIECCMDKEGAVLSLDNIDVQAPFNENPMEKYTYMMRAILNKLNLPDILEGELLYLSNGCVYNTGETIQPMDAIKNGTSNDDNKRVFKEYDEDYHIEYKITNEANEDRPHPNVNSEENIVNTSQTNIVDTNINQAQHSAIDSGSLENKERKDLKICKSNYPKLGKITNLSNYEMINLIPSVKDDFDESTFLLTSNVKKIKCEEPATQDLHRATTSQCNMFQTSDHDYDCLDFEF